MKKKVLVIDDERTIRMLLENFLQPHYEISTQANGRDALHHMQEGNIPDLIIADINMPEMDGYAFVENIRASGYFKDIPVIMLSANENSSEKVKFLKLGANDYVVKPFNPEELLLRIQILLQR